jgi:predicted AAA+ superfamily ATPase
VYALVWPPPIPKDKRKPRLSAKPTHGSKRVVFKYTLDASITRETREVVVYGHRKTQKNMKDHAHDHARKQGLDHMGVSLIERHSVSFTTRFWTTFWSANA